MTISSPRTGSSRSGCGENSPRRKPSSRRSRSALRMPARRRSRGNRRNGCLAAAARKPLLSRGRDGAEVRRWRGYLFVLLALTCASQCAAAGLVAIRGASTWDSSQAAFVPGRTIVIEDGRIKSVSASNVSLSTGATVLDGRGKWVIPGLIDAHVHIVHVLDFVQVTGDEVMPLYL